VGLTRRDVYGSGVEYTPLLGVARCGVAADGAADSTQQEPAGTAMEGKPWRITAGIFYVLRTGIQWQAVPRERFGPPSTVYHYFSKWVRAGVFERL